MSSMPASEGAFCSSGFGSSPLNKLQELGQMAKYLEENQPWQIQNGEVAAMCWALAANYWTLLITGQHPQGEGKESRAAVATQTAAEPELNLCQEQSALHRTRHPRPSQFV